MLGKEKVSKVTPHLKVIARLHYLNLSKKKHFDLALKILESQLN